MTDRTDSSSGHPSTDTADVFTGFVCSPPVAEVSSTAVRQYVRALLTRPWSLRTTRWTTSLETTEVESRLRQHYQTQDGDADTTALRWTGTNSSVISSSEILYTTDGDIIVDRQLPGYARAGTVVAVLGAVLFVLSGHAAVSALVVGGIILGFGLPTTAPLPIEDANGRRAARKTTGVPGLAMVIAIAAVWVTADFNPTYPVFSGVFLSLLVGQVVLMYLDNALPGIKTGIGETVLYIPLFGITQTLLALVLFYLVGGIFGGYHIMADAWVEFLWPGFTGPRSSLYADLTGQTVFPSEAVDRELLMRGFFVSVGESLQTLIWAVICWYLISVLVAWRIKRTLLQNRLTEFGPHGRYFILSGTLLANIGILIGLVFAVDILAHGLLDRSLFSPAIYTPLVDGYVSSQAVTGAEFIDGLYAAFDYLFRDGLPVSSRVIGAGILAFVLWPFLLISGLTVTTSVTRPLRHRLILWRTAPLTEYDAAPDVADDIHVRVLGSDGAVDIRPLPLWFGATKYVVMTDTVATGLTDKQLEALIRHEEYHLRNREYSLTATLFSLTVGGRNALLAFHDYPSMERSADDFAVEKVGALPLAEAIRRVWSLKDGSTPSSGDISIGTPGFLSSPRDPTVLTAVTESLSAVANLDRQALKHHGTKLLGTLDSISSSMTDILFGMVIYDAAHLMPNERIDRLDQQDS